MALSTIPAPVQEIDGGDAEAALAALRLRVEALEAHVAQSEQRRRAMLHIMTDLAASNRRLNDQRKAMIHIMGDLRDTTEEIRQREQELREKQEQLVQAAKLATLGELTTGVAHELNNPLNNIGLYIGNVLDRLKLGAADQGRITQDLDRAMQQVLKATEIITHLRTFGRAAPASRAHVSVNATIGSAYSLLREQLRLHQIEVALDLSPDDPHVLGNAIQLEQVILNLLTNARDAVADSVQRWIGIETSIEEGMVRLSVADSGPGIPHEMQQRIFDPFFTTKDVGEGTGLGLSIVYGIIQDHGGSISVASNPGEGATFTVRLPLTSQVIDES
jgi:C4-dicarboxylate-specific signal transduction histidine kinase